MLVSTDCDNIEGYFEDFNYLKLNIQLGWQKLNDYYIKLDDSAVYVTAFILHPKYRWAKLEQLWVDRPGWIANVKKTFEPIWQYYKKLDIGKATGLVSNQQLQQQSKADFLKDFLTDEAEFLPMRVLDWAPAEDDDQQQI